MIPILILPFLLVSQNIAPNPKPPPSNPDVALVTKTSSLPSNLPEATNDPEYPPFQSLITQTEDHQSDSEAHDLEPSGTIYAESSRTLYAEPSGKMYAEQSGTIHAEPYGTIHAEQSGTIHAEQSGTIHAEQSGTIHAEQSGTIHAEQSGTIHAEQSGTMYAEPYGTIHAEQSGTMFAELSDVDFKLSEALSTELRESSAADDFGEFPVGSGDTSAADDFGEFPVGSGDTSRVLEEEFMDMNASTALTTEHNKPEFNGRATGEYDVSSCAAREREVL